MAKTVFSLECENGFKRWQNKCYLYLEVEKEWNRTECSYWSSKSKLVSIHSQDENDYVESLFNYKSGLSAWTGGYLNPSTGAWAWIDGSAFDYSNWATGEPTGSAPKSIMMYGRAGPEPGKWNDEHPTAECTYEPTTDTTECTTKVAGFVCSYNLFDNIETVPFL